MADPRWTDETESALVRANHAAECGGDLSECVFLAEHRDAAVDALRVVADLGLLLPPGSSGSYDQYRTGDRLCCQLEAGSENYVHIARETRHTHVHTVTTWPDGTVLTGPWVEVTE